MAEICPGDLNGFLFPSGGGEANEAAIRMARLYTGKQKIFTQYRWAMKKAATKRLFRLFVRGWRSLPSYMGIISYKPL